MPYDRPYSLEETRQILDASEHRRMQLFVMGGGQAASEVSFAARGLKSRNAAPTGAIGEEFHGFN
jgi:hypothetical protein